ncbi:hypothetical protein SPBR_07512 [Sporothrix brasiliensis 5110]|uniref:Uncharacterized protein n=1 Tax=Sporothrix brasiliensis 5110 TaxID=1398154 RepID=A0A0C2ISY0_9PEZI|nr:uncharacterized protein SPBR_07512 [Sporothrix brasiliensis 5110]KIH88097.1 hypothetical protein SPBR_07512 [Sporothrix brasiliensis 5110]
MALHDNMTTITPPSGSRQPATPSTSVSSVRAIVSWLEKSGRSEDVANRTGGSVRGKIATGRVAAAHFPTPSPDCRPPGSSRPAVVANESSIIKDDGQTTNRTTENRLNKMPENVSEIHTICQEKVQENTAGKGVGNVAVAPVTAFGKALESISVKMLTKADASLSPNPASPPVTFSQTKHTLFPRNASPVRRINTASTASLPTSSFDRDGPIASPVTPTTPCWRRRQFAEDHCDRSALVRASASLPAMPPTPTTPTTPTPATPMRAPAEYSETPEDYSLTLLRYKAYFERPLARSLAGEDEVDDKCNSGGGCTKKKGGVPTEATVADGQACHCIPRRQSGDVEAFWVPVRQYLLITDEELYES